MKELQVTRYIARDGAEFASPSACRAHEFARLPGEFNKHGVRNLDGSVFDRAREILDRVQRLRWSSAELLRRKHVRRLTGAAP